MFHFEPRSNEPLPLSADPYLAPFAEQLAERRAAVDALRNQLTGGEVPLADFASGHEYYGLHSYGRDGWIFREWAPNASAIWLVGDFSGWENRSEFALKKINANGDWELCVPADRLSHGMHYMLRMEWPGGGGERIPAYARYVVQDETTKAFSAVVWQPEQPYRFRNPGVPRPDSLLIYESHVGMAQEEARVGTFREYREKILPMLAQSGYNTIQLMAVMSHPYYGSFGYHVANFFSISSRFGTPDELKELVDAAHGYGLRVIIDLVHSHAVKNEIEGLAKFDGTRYAYFHEGARGEHLQWDSLCFDYSKVQVLHFLLSNCRFWLDEYHLDGFRFDGVTSMLYEHHGMGKAFTGYGDYFGNEVNGEAMAYLALANEVIHAVNPEAVTVAEDVSGMPGLAAPEGGCGFDYRMAMGVTDMWFKLFDIADENWSMHYLYHELTNRRQDERTVSYVECHDQSIVGGQSAIFRLAGAAMYDAMGRNAQNPAIDRAVALHKMARLATLATAGHGYLNFMGNEFGHPEWVDFPREGNNWSCYYARRQWSLAENPDLRYRGLRDFDRAMLALVNGDPAFFLRVPQLARLDELAKVVVFERDGYWFCFNFHPTHSVTDYAVEVPPGVYRQVLNTDSPEFGGFGLVEPDQRYFSISVAETATRSHQVIRLYLPCRSALVLRKEPRE